MCKGVFYAVSVGSGDPMDLTLHAKKILEQADVIVMPIKKIGADSIAYAIAEQVVDLQQKEKIKIVFPMQRAASYQCALQSDLLQPVYQSLDAGKIVAMVTLGDVSIYSTAHYVRQVVMEHGYQTHVIAGVPSFCAGAAKAMQSLCQNGESLIVIPGVMTQEKIEQAILQFDNLIIMKAGNILSWLLPMLQHYNRLEHTVMLQNVGMSDEYIGTPIAENPSYFTTLLVKRKE